LINDIIADEVKKTNAELTSFKQIKKFTIRELEFEKTTTQKIKRYLVLPK
jgi:long-chain acyl-CoA synthetase